MNTLDLLKELTSPTCVGGDENDFINLIKPRLTELGDVRVDNLNNLFCTFGDGYHFILDAHMDEIGMIVTGISDDGFVKFAKCGGIDARMLLGYEVEILGNERIFGVISTLPPHLQTSNDEKMVPDIKDLSIDTCFSKKQLQSKISIGDRIVFYRNFTPLLNDRLSSSCLDDRCGIAAIINAAQIIKKKNITCKITVVCSTQEELGTRGGKLVAFDNDVDEAISVDVSFAMSPGCDKADCGELSKGPMIGISPILNKQMTNSIVQAAKDNDIHYQLEVMGGATGTNADVITTTGSGIKTALISIPQRYMHSPVELIDINDVDDVSNLIAAYIEKRVGEQNA